MTDSVDVHFRECAELTRLGPLLADGLPMSASDSGGLARLAEAADVSLRGRLAACALLAVVGDPRLPPVPTVLRVQGGHVTIGLRADRVDAVVARWRHVGVERPWIEKEVPAWPVRLDDFWLGRYPVANVQYLAFLQATGWGRRPSTWYLGAYPWDRPSHPVCGIAPDDADAYAAWLSGETGHPYRLPAEAEWEHAANGFDGREYPWGDEFDPFVSVPTASGTRAAGGVTAEPEVLVLKAITAVGVLSASGCIADTVELYASGAVDPHPLVAATVTLEDVTAVLAGERRHEWGDAPKIHVDPRR
jgi:toxoflavin biosynthesis protein ToxD